MKKKMVTLAAGTLVLSILLLATAAPAGAIECGDLAGIPYGGATITSAEMVVNEGCDYCKVLATVGQQTDIEVRLPDCWENGFIHLGGGGFDGAIPNLDRYEEQLQMGYVLAASNGGHRTDDYPGATFGLDPKLTQDYAYTAIGTTLRVAKALVVAYYGESPRYSYFVGCSNGGRGAFNAAAKYLLEYDGVVAGAPTRNLSGLIAGGWVGNLSANILTPAKLETINDATLAACDALDGLEDSIISNPDVCDFDPVTIQCPPGEDNDSCLTEEEIVVVNGIRNDTKLADGTLIYSRVGFGFLSAAPAYGFLGVGHLQYIVYRDPSYDVAGFDLDDDFPFVEEMIEGAYDFSADTRQLVEYLRSGRKMITWHGTDDTLLSHYDTIRTFYEVVKDAGGKGLKNAKLYTASGVGHCGGGPGADTFDMIAAITDWVEYGKEPKTLSASKVDFISGDILFTRPLCEYPKYPRYIGHGDPNNAANFRCIRPKHGKGRFGHHHFH